MEEVEEDTGKQQLAEVMLVAEEDIMEEEEIVEVEAEDMEMVVIEDRMDILAVAEDVVVDTEDMEFALFSIMLGNLLSNIYIIQYHISREDLFLSGFYILIIYYVYD